MGKMQVEYRNGFLYIDHYTITPEQIKTPERVLGRIYHLLKDGVPPDVVCDFISALDDHDIYRVDWIGSVRV